MKKFVFRWPYLFFCLVFVFSACTQSKDIDNLIAYTVQKVDFNSEINVSGVLEANQSLSVTVPSGSNSDMQIIFIVDEGTQVHKGDTISKLKCGELEKEYFDALRNIELAKSNFEEVKIKQSSQFYIQQAQLRVNEAMSSISLLDSTRLQFYTPAQRRIAELRIEKTKIAKTKITNSLESLRKIQNSELQQQQLKIKKQEDKAARMKETLDHLGLVADTSGFIQYERLWSTDRKPLLGDIVWGQMPMMKIIDASSMQILLNVNENQFKSIKEKQEIEITVDAYPQQKYHGKILNKRPAGKEVKRRSKVKYFEVLASIDSLPRSIQPGLSVSCNLKIDKFTGVLAVPLMAVFEQDSNKVVYIKGKKIVRRQIVKTGIASDKQIIITQGIKPNDQILLTEPSEFLLK